MANVKDKVRFLEEYREHPEKYLPMSDYAWKQYEKVEYGEEWYDDPWYNLGWDAGLVEGNRPYFMICWAACGITMLTYYISAAGIGEYGDQFNNNDRYANGKGKLNVGLDEAGNAVKDYTKVVTPAGKAGVDYHMLAIRFEIDF